MDDILAIAEKFPAHPTTLRRGRAAVHLSIFFTSV